MFCRNLGTRGVLFVASLLFLTVYCFAEDRVAVRVSVQSDVEVMVLHRLGVQLDDAKIRERLHPSGEVRYQVIYNEDNRFVTAVVASDRLLELQRLGFELSHMEPYRRSEGDYGTGEDAIPYQFGWPRTIYNGMTLYENSPTIADMNQDGQLNVSVTNAWGAYSPPLPPYVIVWRRNGTYLSGFPVALQPGQFQSSADGGISAMGDIWGDEKLELVCGDENGYLYAFSQDGQPLPGFPLHFGTFVGVWPAALADIDRDGKSDIIVITHAWDSPYNDAFLRVYTITDTGPQSLSGFPIALERGARNSPSVGDINGDGKLEIVVGTGGTTDQSVLGKVIAFSSEGVVLPGFPWVVGGVSVTNTPTLYDITGDGKLEILIRIKPDGDINGIYAIDYQGNVLPGYPFPVPYGHPGACVAVGDMNGDGIPELAYGGVEAIDLGKVWAYSLSGTLLAGYPAAVFRTWVDGSVAIADVSGDGWGDVVCGTNGVSDKPGLIRAFRYNGQEVPDFPLSPPFTVLSSFTTHPTVVDIDGDGDTEIFAGRTDKNVYGWDTPGVFNASSSWHTYKGNAARTGGQLASPATSAGEKPSNPLDFALYQNYPNPFNPMTTIRFALPVESRVTVDVYNMLGQAVRTLVNEELSPGYHAVTWNGTNNLEQHPVSGVFLVRLLANGRDDRTFVGLKKVILLK